MGQTLSETNINNTLSSRIGPWSNSQWGSRTSGKKQFRKITYVTVKGEGWMKT